MCVERYFWERFTLHIDTPDRVIQFKHVVNVFRFFFWDASCMRLPGINRFSLYVYI